VVLAVPTVLIVPTWFFLTPNTQDLTPEVLHSPANGCS
jgi:hypothetical protein